MRDCIDFKMKLSDKSLVIQHNKRHNIHVRLSNKGIDDQFMTSFKKVLSSWMKAYEQGTKRPLTKGQKRAYDALIEFHKKEGRRPTYEELKNSLGVLSKGTSFRYVKIMIEKGWAYKDSNGNIIPAGIGSPDQVY